MVYSDLKNIPVPSKKYENLLIEILDQRVKGLLASGRLLSLARSQSVIVAHGDDILEAVATFLPSKNNKRLVDLAIEFGGKTLLANYFSPVSTGIAIAGFGSSEVFPSMVVFETDGYVGAQIKLSKPDITTIRRDMESAVSAFAQHDIVHRFMEGIDPDYSDYLRGSVKTALVEGNLKVFEKWAPISRRTEKARRAVQRAAERQFDRLHTAALNYRRTEFWLPTVRMVSILPKDELAHLAESLVELTALHRKVSVEIETVGGPIDVAIISKGDGFVWVRRKHYFKAELNPQFEHNYMREIDGHGRRRRK